MAERATILQGSQIGVETVLGTSVAANKKLNSFNVNLNEAVNIQRFVPLGQKYPTILIPGEEWTTGTLQGKLDYCEIIYPLSSVIGAVAPAQQGATTAWLWTFQPQQATYDTIKSFTIEEGDTTTRAHKASGIIFDSFGFSWSRSAVDVTGTLLAQQLQDGITMTASPTALDQQPVVPVNIDVFLDATSAGLGTTRFTRVLSGSFAIASRFNPVWTMASNNASWAAYVEVEPATTLKLLVEADTQGMTQLTSMRAGTTQFIRVIATSPNLAGTAFPYKIQFDMACKVSAVANFSDSNGVYAIEYTFDVVTDVTWGKPYQILVMNKQTAL
jgi:hypothetical protein